MNVAKFLIAFLMFAGRSLPGKAQEETDSRLHPEGQKGWRFYQTSDTTKSKRVLLIGDSILGGYLAAVSKALKNKVAIDYWLTGLNEGSPGLFLSCDL